MDRQSTIRPCFDDTCQHWLDTSGDRIEAHGAGMLYSPIDNHWYWYGESAKSGSTRELEDSLWTHGVNCYSAPGIAGPWRNEGQVFRQADISIQGLEPPFIVERPKVLFNHMTRIFVMWFHLDRNLDGTGESWYQLNSVGVATSSYAAGPFVFVHAMQPDGLPSLDMSLFLDPLDRQAYLIRSVANEYNAISRLTPDYLNSAGVISEHRPVFEGMAIFRLANGTYYCITSHLTGWSPNPLSLLRAQGSSLENPLWVDMGNPTGDDSSFNSQPTFVISVTPSNGREYFIYMADNWIHAGPGELTDAAYIWLPVQFERDTVALKRLNEWDIDDPFGCSIVHADCCGLNWTESHSLCYAMQHEDLQEWLCTGREAHDCDLGRARCHYAEHGSQEERRHECVQPPAYQLPIPTSPPPCSPPTEPKAEAPPYVAPPSVFNERSTHFRPLSQPPTSPPHLELSLSPALEAKNDRITEDSKVLMRLLAVSPALLALVAAGCAIAALVLRCYEQRRKTVRSASKGDLSSEIEMISTDEEVE